MISTCARRATIEDVPGINAVLNDENVRGTAGFPAGVNFLDAAPTFTRFAYFVFPGGFVLFDPSKEFPGVWEGHIAALKGYRGENALEGAQSALDSMFSDGWATNVIVDFPSHRRDLRNLVRTLGFTQRIGTDSFMLTYEDWKERQ